MLIKYLYWYYFLVRFNKIYLNYYLRFHTKLPSYFNVFTNTLILNYKNSFYLIFSWVFFSPIKFRILKFKWKLQYLSDSSVSQYSFLKVFKMLTKKSFYFNPYYTYSLFFFINNIYGFKYKTWIFFAHSGEALVNAIVPDQSQGFFKYFYMFVPNTNYPYNLNIYYILLLLAQRSYRGFRMLFGYPTRGQRTWTNANTAKRLNEELLWLKTKQFKTCTFYNYNSTEVLSEYINFIWYLQWNLEWVSMRKNRISHKFFKKNPKKFLKFNDIINFRIEHFEREILDRKKFKSHRKKRRLDRNSITGGFKFGFIHYYRKLL